MLQTVQFNYPFPARLSKHADYLETLIGQWLLRYDCLSSDFKEKLRLGRFGTLAAHFFPLASRQQLIFMTRWNLAFFAFDDLYGPLPLPALIQRCNRAIAILKGAPANLGDDEIFRQIAILRQELTPYVVGHPHWMDQFTGSMALFFEGMQTDTAYSYKETVSYPTLAQYIQLREKIVATYPLLDFAELEVGAILPPEVIKDPTLRRLRQLACRLVSWSNDIYSLRKEMEDHEAMNLVLVIRNEYGCSMQQAISRAYLIHDHDLEEYVLLSSELTGYGRHTKDVNRYVRAISLLVSGHIAWYNHTYRY